MSSLIEINTVEMEKKLLEALQSFNINAKNTHTSARKEQIDNLRTAYIDEELVFVLGAGVSVPYKLPSWETLLQRLLLKTMQNGAVSSDSDQSLTALASLFTKVFTSSPLVSARYLEQYYKENNISESFETSIRNIIYENIDRSVKSDTFEEIKQYCIAPGRSPNLDSIITYNYDDILEDTLRNSGIDIPFRSIYKVGDNPKNGELPIYHVHGYLPFDGELTADHRVTLSEFIYHQQYADVYSWNNIVQINKFRERICFFIGVSLSDPNIRRLLDIAIKQRGTGKGDHYIIKRRYEIKDIEKNLDFYLSSDDKLLDQKSKGNLSFEEASVKLKKMMEDFEELDAKSFGIQIIWIDSFNEIPDVLKSIRLT
jgi:hypothetical protein